MNVKKIGLPPNKDGIMKRKMAGKFNFKIKCQKMLWDNFKPNHFIPDEKLKLIGEEKAHNPRLQVSSEQAYVAMMNALKLDNPKLMDIAVPANLKCGRG